MKVAAAVLLILFIIGTASAITQSYYVPSTAQDGRITNNTVEQNYYLKRLGPGSTMDTTGTDGLMNIGAISFVTPALNSNTLVRFFTIIDTSGVNDTTTISSASMCYYGTTGGWNGAGNINMGITGYSPADNSTLAVGDYDNLNLTAGGDPYSDTYILYSTWDSAGAKCFPLNTAGIAAINKTGITAIALRMKDDIFNTTTDFTTTTSATTYIKGYDSSSSDASKRPYLSITDNSSAAPSEVSFYANVSSGTTCSPVCNVGFTDNSNATGIKARVWQYKSYDALPEPYCDPYPSCNWTKTQRTFSNTASPGNPTPTLQLGAGNWSIELDVKDVSDVWHNTTHPYYWINVSAGNAGMERLPADYQFGEADQVWYQNISNTTLYPIDSHNTTWMNKLDAVDHGYTNLATFLKNSQNEYFVINDTNISISHQKFSNDNVSSTYYDYGSVGGNGGFPIPDDSYASSTSGSDRMVDFIDIQNNIVYTISNTRKSVQGIWSGSPTIANYSSYCYRFSAFYNGTDNGCTWLGNKWYTISSGTLTPRREQVMWYPGDAGIGLPVLFLRYEEVDTGFVNHTLMGTIHLAEDSGVWWGVGSGEGYGDCADGTCAPIGTTVRLKESYNVSDHDFNTMEKTIAQTLKSYGMILVNTGSSNGFMINGYNDSHWVSTDLDNLSTEITYKDLEFVNISSLMVYRYSTQSNTILEAVAPTFTKNKLVVRIPSLITFTGTTSPDPYQYNWSFGDGTYSDVKSPSHKYTRPGRFNVSLTTPGGIAYANVIVIGGSSDQKLNPSSSQNSVSCEDMTYTVSREITDMEMIRTDEKIAGVCGI